MRKFVSVLLLFLAAIPFASYGDITFKVEELSKPEGLLPVTSYRTLCERLIASDLGMGVSGYNKKYGDLGIVAISEAPDSLVSLGYHAFVDGMYRAYAEHRPFVLSPDMIWLLISQGFARHINAAPEKYRDLFVEYGGRMTLVVRSDNSLGNPNSKWADIFPQFTEQIAANVKGDIVETLTADFSTTTPTSLVASQITIMDAMKSYFEYVHIFIGCGIPEITLLGTTEDWEKIVRKTEAISKYDLQWWTKEIMPLLKEFVKASKGNVDTTFWRNMFKYHTSKAYGQADRMDGWILKFFPYFNNDKRNNFTTISSSSVLPQEIVKVDMKHIYMDEKGGTKEAMLEIWAGFVGLEQNRETFALTPRIGWMIKKKGSTDSALTKELEDASNDSWGVRIRVKEVPAALLEAKHIGKLTIEFVDKIYIPEKMKNIRIDCLKLKGKIDDAEYDKIYKMFPETMLEINGKLLVEDKSGRIVEVDGGDIIILK